MFGYTVDSAADKMLRRNLQKNNHLNLEDQKKNFVRPFTYINEDI